jgi:hypothetical protein
VRQAERASEIEGWTKSPEPPQPATAATSKAE